MMNLYTFSRQVRAAHDQMESIRRQLNETPHDASLAQETMEALQVTVEQLHVAEQELRVQHEEIESTRQAAEEQYQRYLNLYEFAPDGYLVTDARGVIRETNRAGAEMFGIAPEYLNGKPLALYVEQKGRSAFRQKLLLLQSASERQEWEVRIRPRQGEEFDAQVAVLPQRDYAGKVQSLRWLIRDITRRKQGQAEIRRLNAELEARVEERTLELENALRAMEELAQENAKLYQQANAAYNHERQIAETLQRSFLPQLPEDVPGLNVGQMYVPARDDALVGGDFYDLFSLGEGRYGIVIGDVAGKGIPAAVATAMTKYVLHGFASEFQRPADVLDKLDRFLCEQLPDDRFVTLFYGVIDLGEGSLTYASAGHEPVVLEAPCDGLPSHGDAPAEHQTLYPTGPVLGTICAIGYHEHRVEFPAGASLLLCTDGLTEARQEGTFWDIEGVIQAFRETWGRPVEERVQALFAAGQAFNRTPLRDDTAILLLHNSIKETRKNREGNAADR